MKIQLSLAVVAWSCLFLVCGKDGGKDAPVVEQFTVKRVDLRDIMLQTGEVQPVVKIEVKSEASGRIQKIYVKEGQKINRRDTILTIDPQRLLYRKERIDLSIQKAQLDRDRARRDLDNNQQLAATGTISDKDLQDFKMQFEAADIACKQQQLELKDIVDELQRTVVMSPMTGVLTLLNVEEGEIAVSATSGFQAGTSIGTIADISKLEVVSQIGEVDYVHLRTGQKVVIRPQAFEDRETWGTITFIALSAKKVNNQDLGSFEVRVAIDSVIPGIAPGINVNVEFVIMEKKDVLGVPYQCVTKEKGKAFVQVPDPKGAKGALRKAPVQIGSTDFKFYEVLSGLKEGDVVVFKESLEDRGKGSGGRGGPGGRR